MIIKKFLDVRTASKIEIFSFKSSAEKRLCQLIDRELLPSEYGGNGQSVMDTILKKDLKSGTNVLRRFTKLMHFKSHGSVQFELEKDEEIDVSVYTRSASGAVFSIDKVSTKVCIAGPVTVKCPIDLCGENANPFHVVIGESLQGSGKFKVNAECIKGRLSSSDCFLFIGTVKRI